MKGIEIGQPQDSTNPGDQDRTTTNEGYVTATAVLIRGGRRPLPICRIRDAIFPDHSDDSALLYSFVPGPRVRAFARPEALVPGIGERR